MICWAVALTIPSWAKKRISWKQTVSLKQYEYYLLSHHLGSGVDANSSPSVRTSITLSSPISMIEGDPSLPARIKQIRFS